MAGELVEAADRDNVGEVNGLLYGDGTGYCVPPGGFGGFRNRVVIDADVPLLGGGDYPGVDRYAGYDVIVPINIGTGDQFGPHDEDLEVMQQMLEAAWAIGPTVEHHWRVRGVHWMVEGRCRDLDVDERGAYLGVIRVLATFHVTTPTLAAVGS